MIHTFQPVSQKRMLRIYWSPIALGWGWIYYLNANCSEGGVYYTLSPRSHNQAGNNGQNIKFYWISFMNMDCSAYLYAI